MIKEKAQREGISLDEGAKGLGAVYGEGEISNHAKDRQRERNVNDEEIKQALNDPKSRKEQPKIDDQGRVSQRISNDEITVVINPDTGKVITAWRNKSKK